jgi:hypothetical protein
MFPQAAVDLIRCDHPPTSRYTLLAHVGMLLDTAGCLDRGSAFDPGGTHVCKGLHFFSVQILN